MAADALKFGLPAGLFFLIWFGLKFGASTAHGLATDGLSTFAPVSTSHFVTIVNFYALGVFIVIVALAIGCIFARSREAILYELLSLRTWMVASAVFGLEIALYVTALWLLGEGANTFSGLAFGMAIALFIFSIVNLVNVGRSRGSRTV